MSAPRAVVCYDEARPGMYLRIEGQDIASFMASAAWRAWLYYPASAVDGTDRDRILLDGGMGLRECQDMLEAIMEADGHGVEVAVDPSFGAFVNAGETYIRERSEVGLAIKAQTAEGIADDPQLGPRFREFRDVVNASMVRPLRDRQMLDAFFMATVGRAADFSVPGAGKTATVLGVFAYLRHLGLARRIVVVCPKNGFESWEKEWVATFGDKLPLSCFSLGDPAIAAMSTERRRNALSLDSGACNLFTFNYESLSGYVRELHAIIPDQTLLVFDEVHRVKAIGGRRAEAALEAADGAKFVIALTGTPIPNTYQDIYNLLHILYPEDYDTFFGYEPGELRAPDADLQASLNDSLAPFFCRTNKDELGVPRPEPDEIVEVEATPDEDTLLRVLYASCPNALARIIRTLQLESDPEMLCSAVDPGDLEYVLDQVGDDYSDIDYVDFSQTFYEAIERSRPSSKLVACEPARGAHRRRRPPRHSMVHLRTQHQQPPPRPRRHGDSGRGDLRRHATGRETRDSGRLPRGALQGARDQPGRRLPSRSLCTASATTRCISSTATTWCTCCSQRTAYTVWACPTTRRRATTSCARSSCATAGSYPSTP